MSLNNIFQMIKADRYTADGREEIKKALAEETEDRTYNIGEISEKTGLQKTANGWVKPKKGNAGSAKRSGATSSEADSPEARKNYEDFMKEHKKREFQELYGDAIKFDEYGLPSKETIELKNNFLRKEGVSDPNKLTNKEFNDLAKKIDEQFGINNLERSQELLVAESEQSKPTEKKAALKLPDEKSSFSTDVNRMKKLKKEDYKQYTIQLEKLHSKYPINKWKDLLNKTTQDEAPRVLTGDCKIRIRK